MIRMDILSCLDIRIFTAKSGAIVMIIISCDRKLSVYAMSVPVDKCACTIPCRNSTVPVLILAK